MTVLLLGATGATGRLVAKELIDRGYQVKAIVRSLMRVDTDLISNEQMEITVANFFDLTEQQLIDHVKGCEAVVCCLGHNLTLKGMYGHPRKLVTEATKRVCQAVVQSKPLSPVKFVLMSTTGYQNTLKDEMVSWRHKMVVALLRKVLPPHVDNEQAASYLQYDFSDSTRSLEWVAVRPDNLVDLPDKTNFTVYPSPISDPIFASLKSSRANVAHFMVDLISSNVTWIRWKNEMPVVYNGQ
jgi:nucleoside-diphosphate-sugar epimerase